MVAGVPGLPGTPSGSAVRRPGFTQPLSTAYNKSEIATLLVRGEYFSDWETVWIRDQWETVYPEFRFTAAEREREQPDWKKLQFFPGDGCSIYLANIKAVQGVIVVRQVAYDANNHGVSLQGVGLGWFAARASIVPSEKNNGANFKGPLLKIAQDVLADTGIKVKPVGDVPAIPWDDPPAHANPGETMFAFIERLAKERNVILGSTPDGGTWLLIGTHSPPVEGDLVEGFNILSAQVVIQSLTARSSFISSGQFTGSDQQNMRKSQEQQAELPGTLGRYSPLYTPVEHPVKTMEEIVLRARHEQMWNEGTDIEATITVQGWFNPRTSFLWKAGQVYRLRSPMVGIDQPLSARSVTFTQDRSSGTRTTLDLVQPWRLKQSGYISAAKDDPTKKPANTSQDANKAPVATQPDEITPDQLFKVPE